MPREASGDPGTRVRIHYHRPDRGTTVFEEHLLLDRPEVKVTLLDRYAGAPAAVAGRRILDAGAPIIWFVFPALWRDVGRFHLADGGFTGWYTNLRTPISFDGPDWACTDLFLDHWLPASGPPTWLDEDELAAARAAGLVTDEVASRLARERAEIEALVERGDWPPQITRELTLEWAHRVLDR